MIKLIVSDIDGTMCAEGQGTIDSEYFEIIRKLTDQGIQFAIASGRPKEEIDEIFHSLRENIYYLSDNGATIIKNGKILDQKCLDKEIAKQLIIESRQMDQCISLISTINGIYFDNGHPRFHELINRLDNQKIMSIDALSAADQCVKLCIFCSQGATPVYNLLVNQWKEFSAIHISAEVCVDFNALNVSKGNAVSYIQKKMGILPEETMVFGDNYNDISMFQCAGVSYVPTKSAYDVRKNATHEMENEDYRGELRVLTQWLKENI